MKVRAHAVVDPVRIDFSLHRYQLIATCSEISASYSAARCGRSAWRHPSRRRRCIRR